MVTSQSVQNPPSCARPFFDALYEFCFREGLQTLLTGLRWLFLVLTSLLSLGAVAIAQEAAVTVPPPAVDELHSTGKVETAVFAGGCYWGTQGLFEHVVGVQRVVAGMAGNSGPAESVEITYDSNQITYGQLLQIFFSVAHDPTQLDRQGPDEGTRYRSDVFYQDDEQKQIAQDYVKQLEEAHVFSASIVTRIDPYSEFHRVDFSQQDYLIKHPTDDYIVTNDLPKISNLQRMYPSLFRAEPVRYSD